MPSLESDQQSSARHPPVAGEGKPIDASPTEQATCGMNISSAVFFFGKQNCRALLPSDVAKEMIDLAESYRPKLRMILGILNT
jgi:hypothetical protein